MKLYGDHITPVERRGQARRAKDPSKPIPFGVFDIEALDWNGFRCAVYMSSEGDIEVFKTADKMSEFIGKQERRVCALFGGRYDFFFLPKPSQVIMSGSGILKARHGKAELYDSWMKFQMPLKKIGKAVGIEKYEDKSNRIQDLTLEETIEHCINDTRILQRAEHLHQEWCKGFDNPNPRWPPTAGATAVYVAEALEKDSVNYLGNQSVACEEWFWHDNTTNGGRVELHEIGIKTNVYAYDINSSYPKSWLEAFLPLGPWTPVNYEVPNLPGIYWCEVKQSRKHLPVVAPEHRWRYDGYCWCTTEELQVLRDTGGAARVARGYVSSHVGPFAHRFVEELYRQKQAGSPWAKVSINSLHGKFTQGLLQGAYYPQRDGTWAIDRELLFPAWYQRPIIGAFVYARARLRLWKMLEALRQAGWKVYYCDTDSVHTDCPPDKVPFVLGELCGEVKLEARASRAVYVAPKVYGLELVDNVTGAPILKDGKQEYKLCCKGFPRDVITFDILCRAAAGESIPLSNKAGLIAFLSQKQWGAEVHTLSRTLTAQPGAGKVRRGKHALEYIDLRA